MVEIILGSWLEPKDEVEELVDVRSDRVSDRQSVVYRMRGHNPDGPFVVEQNAFLERARRSHRVAAPAVLGLPGRAGNGSIRNTRIPPPPRGERAAEFFGQMDNAGNARAV